MLANYLATGKFSIYDKDDNFLEEIYFKKIYRVNYERKVEELAMKAVLSRIARRFGENASWKSERGIKTVPHDKLPPKLRKKKKTSKSKKKVPKIRKKHRVNPNQQKLF